MSHIASSNLNSINIQNSINKIEEQYRSLYNRVTMYLLLTKDDIHENYTKNHRTNTKEKTSTHTELIFNIE